MEIKGGGKLSAELGRIAKSLKGAYVNVGFLENATYSDGTSVAAVAYTNEFGRPTVGQPARPYFRSMIAENSGKWPAMLAKSLKATNYDAHTTFVWAGEELRGQLQESINKLETPPLAASTIAAKGFSKPLIDSSHMLNSADFEVHA
jgi:hypothetical protein